MRLRRHHGLTPFAWLALVVMLGATVGLSAVVHRHERDRARHEFDRVAAQIRDALTDELTDYGQVLQAAAGFLSATPSVTLQQWHVFVDGINIDPGIAAVGFARREPSVNGRDRCPLVLVGPPTKGEIALGFDEYSEPGRREAMDRARDSGAPTLSSAVTLVLNGPAQPPRGFVLFVPVYDNALPHTTVVERRLAIRGFAVGAVHLERMLERAFAIKSAGVGFDLYDGPDRRSGSLLYDDPAVSNDATARNALFDAVTSTDVAGRTFTIVTASTVVFAGVDVLPERLTAGVGALVSLLVFGLVALIERKRDERVSSELSKSAAEVRRLAAIVENSTDHIGIASLDGHLLYVNPAGLAMIGAEADDVIGQPVATIVADLSTHFEQLIADVHASGGWRGEGALRHLKTGASIPCDVTAFVVRSPDDNAPMCLGCIIRDVSERQRLEREVRSAQKMEAIGTLAGGIAHDFNNMLGAMLGYAEFAAEDASGNEAVLGNIEQITLAGRRATELVRSILTFSRQQEHDRSPMRLEPVAKEALKLLRASLPATVELRTSFSSEPLSVLADPTQIHQVLMNLATNAWHAIGDRPGSITVTLEPFEVDEAFARTHLDLRAGRYARLSVADDGMGMDAVTQQRIFEPFYTTKAPGVGTGLGLSTVHGIVKSHEGAISVYSRLGEGTTFHVFLPSAAIEEVQEAATGTPIPRGHGEHVLLVDDERPLASWGRQALERLGYRVTAETDPRRAFGAIAADPTKFDVLVLDYAMPAMNGFQFAERVRSMRPNLPIVMTTGYPPQGDLASVGVHELVMKPSTIQTLGDAVHRALVAVH